jgi:hypothetical protein
MHEESRQPLEAPALTVEDYLELNALTGNDPEKLIGRIVELEKKYLDNPVALQLLAVLNPLSEVSRIGRLVARLSTRYFTEEQDEGEQEALRTYLLMLIRQAEALTPEITREVAKFYLNLQ